MKKKKPFILHDDIKYIEYHTEIKPGDLCVATHNCGNITDNLLFIYNGNYIYSYYCNSYFALLELEDISFVEKIKIILPTIDREISKRNKQTMDDKIKNLKTLNKKQKTKTRKTP